MKKFKDDWPLFEKQYGNRKKKGDMFSKRANINRIAYFQADSAMGAAFYYLLYLI